MPFSDTHATNDKNSLGARSAAMGNASVTFADGFAVFANQAALARLQSTDIALYAENRFLLPDLNLYAMGIGIPTRNAGTFGLGITNFGNAGYNEQQLSLAYSRLLFKKLAIGAAFELRNYAMHEQGSRQKLTFGVGLLYNINPQLAIGAHIYNPISQQLTSNDADLMPSIIKLGAAFTPTDRISISTEAEKNINTPMQFKAGIEYKLVQQLYLRGGFDTEPSVTSFGIGLHLSAFRIDIANTFHPTLGYSPAISLRWSGKARKAADK